MQRIIKGNSPAQLNDQLKPDWRIVPGSVQVHNVLQKNGEVRPEWTAVTEQASITVEVFEVPNAGRFPFGFRRQGDHKQLTEMMEYEAACDFKRDLEALGVVIVNLTEYTFEG